VTTRRLRRALRDEVQSEYEVNSDFRGDQLTPAVYALLEREWGTMLGRPWAVPELATLEGTSARLGALLAHARALPTPESDTSVEWGTVENAWKAQQEAMIALAATCTTAYLLGGKAPRVTPNTHGMDIFEAIRTFCNGPLWRKLYPLLRAKQSGRVPATRSIEGWAARLEALLPLTTSDELVSFAALATHGFLERYMAATRHENAIGERRYRAYEAEAAAWRAAHPEEAKRRETALSGFGFDALLTRDVQ
jgi:hypothetical protein